MKRIYQTLAVGLPIAIMSFLQASAAHAEPIFKLDGLAKYTDPNQEVGLIIKYLLGIAFTLAVAGIVVGGFLYLTSAGNEDRAERGKKVIEYSIIGLVVIALAYVITNTVNNLFANSTYTPAP